LAKESGEEYKALKILPRRTFLSILAIENGKKLNRSETTKLFLSILIEKNYKKFKNLFGTITSHLSNMAVAVFI